MKLKRIISTLLIVAMVVSGSVTAFAATSTTNVTGYCSLTGVLNVPDGVYASVSVATNPDSAYLRLKITVDGGSVDTRTSSKGATGYSVTIPYAVTLDSTAHTAYGTHEVYGGTTYAAAAVYTYYSWTD